LSYFVIQKALVNEGSKACGNLFDRGSAIANDSLFYLRAVLGRLPRRWSGLPGIIHFGLLAMTGVLLVGDLFDLRMIGF
jgi:hypothetical protein